MGSKTTKVTVTGMTVFPYSNVCPGHQWFEVRWLRDTRGAKVGSFVQCANCETTKELYGN